MYTRSDAEGRPVLRMPPRAAHGGRPRPTAVVVEYEEGARVIHAEGAAEDAAAGRAVG